MTATMYLCIHLPILNLTTIIHQVIALWNHCSGCCWVKCGAPQCSRSSASNGALPALHRRPGCSMGAAAVRDVGGLLRSHSWQCTWPWRGAPERLEKDLLFLEFQHYESELLVGQKIPRKVRETWQTELERIQPPGYKINWGIEGGWEKTELRLCPKGVWISF